MKQPFLTPLSRVPDLVADLDGLWLGEGSEVTREVLCLKLDEGTLVPSPDTEEARWAANWDLGGTVCLR